MLEKYLATQYAGDPEVDVITMRVTADSYEAAVRQIYDQHFQAFPDYNYLVDLNKEYREAWKPIDATDIPTGAVFEIQGYDGPTVLVVKESNIQDLSS